MSLSLFKLKVGSKEWGRVKLEYAEEPRETLRPKRIA